MERKDLARYGWNSDFPQFINTEAKKICEQLISFLPDASEGQRHAWNDSIPRIQNEVNEILIACSSSKKYETILEYELPMESRRTDVIFLAKCGVVVIELKGKNVPSQADIDQAAAYGRDLRFYHRECATYPVHVLLVPTRAQGYVEEELGVHILGPDVIDDFIITTEKGYQLEPPSRDSFLSAEAYCPLPTIVQAARELMQSGKIRPIHRARAATDPAIEAITNIIHEAAATKTRKLILLTGVPGSGKTLVGLQIAHANFLDDLAIPRANGTSTVPAVFLSGNGPLVEVLQYELRAAGGGKAFVRGVKNYVKTYSTRQHLVPPEHVLIFDEAQRAFDAEQVRKKHTNTPGFGGGKSEPEHFIEFAERIPEWCVVIGLIGSGQEIHVGEEGGLSQWCRALEGAKEKDRWSAYAPDSVKKVFENSTITNFSVPQLNLDQEIRFHMASDLHNFVAQLLEGVPVAKNEILSQKLERDNYHLRITRDLDQAKSYLRERYAEHPEARFGVLASSRDKDLVSFGVSNDYPSTKRIRFGPWYGEEETDPNGRSCRLLKDCVTEFGAQGLELEAVLLAWGTDFVRVNNKWSNARARNYAGGSHVKDPFQLRLNAYRVLLTRGREATVVFVPKLTILDETFEYLSKSGFRLLEG